MVSENFKPDNEFPDLSQSGRHGWRSDEARVHIAPKGVLSLFPLCGDL